MRCAHRTHGNLLSQTDFPGTIDYSTFVSTYDDGSNHKHYQQQVVATISVP